MMRTVHLHGHLGKTFGKSFELNVETAGEAIRALSANFPTFAGVIRDGAWQVIKGKSRKSGEALALDDINSWRLGREDLHIVPVVAGAKSNSGALKVILGVALIGAALFFAPAAGGLAAPLAEAGILSGITYGNIAMIGAGLALAGVSHLLSSPDVVDESEKDDRSYAIAGPTNTSDTGTPIPIIYGEVYTGGILISAGIDIEALPGAGGAGSNVVLNGGFASSSYWEIGDGWTIADGVATKTPGVASSLFQERPFKGGSITIKFTITAITAGSFTPRLEGPVPVVGTARTAPGTYTETLTVRHDSTGIGILASANANGSIDNVSGLYNIR